MSTARPRVTELHGTHSKSPTKLSTFWLTVNLNKPHSAALENDFRNALNTLLSDETYSYLKFKHYRPDRNKPDSIKDTHLQFRIETGPVNGLLHAHMLLQYKHQSNVQIDKPQLRRIISKLTKVPDLHVQNIQYIDDMEWQTRIFDYMTKNDA
jgi:hypothetical protein